MRYHGKVKNCKVNFKKGTATIEVEFPVKTIINEAKIQQKNYRPMNVSLRSIVVNKFYKKLDKWDIILEW